MTFTNRLRSEQERAFIHSKLLASASQPTPGGGGGRKTKIIANLCRHWAGNEFSFSLGKTSPVTGMIMMRTRKRHRGYMPACAWVRKRCDEPTEPPRSPGTEPQARLALVPTSSASRALCAARGAPRRKSRRLPNLAS